MKTTGRMVADWIDGGRLPPCCTGGGAARQWFGTSGRTQVSGALVGRGPTPPFAAVGGDFELVARGSATSMGSVGARGTCGSYARDADVCLAGPLSAEVTPNLALLTVEANGR